jgi:hypothetical protein
VASIYGAPSDWRAGVVIPRPYLSLSASVIASASSPVTRSFMVMTSLRPIPLAGLPP